MSLARRLAHDRYPQAYTAATWILIVAAGWQIGKFATGFAIEKHGQLVALAVAIGLVLAYIGRRLTWSRIFAVTVVSLPFTDAFVLQVGGSVRPAYLLALAALLVGVYTSSLRKVRLGLSGQLLVLFVLYAFLSTIFVLWIDRPVVIVMEDDPFHLSPLRTFIQAGQLVLMLVGFYLALNYLNSRERLRRFSEIIFWSTAFVAAYGLYEFTSLYLDRPFVRLHRNPVDGWVTLGDVVLPRPKATLLEPITLGIYLLFAVPFCCVAFVGERRAVPRLLKLAGTGLAILVFVLANSRSAFLGAVALLVVLGVAGRRRTVWSRPLAVIVVGCIVVGGWLLVFTPVADEPPGVLTGLQSRLLTMTYIMANLERSKEGDVIGRNYAVPVEIFSQNPVLGIGIGNYPFYYKRDEGELIVASTFSLYLRLLTELGLIGTVLFLGFVASIVARLWRLTRHEDELLVRAFATASLLAIVGVLTAMVGYEGIYTDSYLWVMFAAGLAVDRLSRVTEGRASNQEGPLAEMTTAAP